MMIDDGNGQLLFASQVYGNDTNENKPIFMGSLPNSEILKQISRIYPFDLFVHNIDRHVNNYLIRKQNNIERIFAFDHSHSLFRFWPDINLPFKASRKTIKMIRVIKANWGFEESAAQEVVDKLESVPLAAIEGVVREMPGEWLANSVREQFLDWWENESVARVDEIRKGLKNGKFL